MFLRELSLKRGVLSLFAIMNMAVVFHLVLCLTRIIRGSLRALKRHKNMGEVIMDRSKLSNAYSGLNGQNGIYNVGQIVQQKFCALVSRIGY